MVYLGVTTEFGEYQFILQLQKRLTSIYFPWKDFFWVMGKTSPTLGRPDLNSDRWDLHRWLVLLFLRIWYVTKTPVLHYRAMFRWKHILFHKPTKKMKKIQWLCKSIIPNMFYFLYWKSISLTRILRSASDHLHRSYCPIIFKFLNNI